MREHSEAIRRHLAEAIKSLEFVESAYLRKKEGNAYEILIFTKDEPHQKDLPEHLHKKASSLRESSHKVHVTLSKYHLKKIGKDYLLHDDDLPIIEPDD